MNRRMTTRPVALVGALAGLFFILQCGITTNSEGTETNWLQECTGQGHECGKLFCVCGRCTLPCATPAECADAPEPSDCTLAVSDDSLERCQPEEVGFCEPTAILTNVNAVSRDGTSATVSSTTSGNGSGSAEDTGGVANGGASGLLSSGVLSTGVQGTNVATTGGVQMIDCDVDQIFVQSCSSSICHGEPNEPDTGVPPLLFAPDRASAWLDQPGTYCSDELLIDTTNPGASLLLTTLRATAECGVTMPIGLLLPNAEILCIQRFVDELVQGGGGE